MISVLNAVPDFAGQLDRVLERHADTTMKVVEDGAEVIVLGCAGLSGMDRTIQEKLGVPLGLHGSSHDPEGHKGLSVLRDKPRDQRVEGPFSWGNLVWMTVLQGEAGSPVLKNETRSRGHHT